MAVRKAFTLLEVILALALTTVVLALMGMAINVNMGVSEKSRDQVEEAQLARALLQRIADDLRNAVPYQPPAGSSSGSASSSSGGGAASATSATSAASAQVVGSSSGSAASASSNSAANSSSSSGTSSTMPVSGGLSGDIQWVQVETAHRPQPTRAMLAAAADGSQPAMLSDVRIVSYTLGAPNGAGSTGATGDSGLYRSEMDRALFYTAQQQGQTNPGDAVKLGDPSVGEVIDLKFQFYDDTGTENDEWDANQQGKLPSAVRVTLTIRSARKPIGALLTGLGGAACGPLARGGLRYSRRPAQRGRSRQRIPVAGAGRPDEGLDEYADEQFLRQQRAVSKLSVNHQNPKDDLP